MSGPNVSVTEIVVAGFRRSTPVAPSRPSTVRRLATAWKPSTWLTGSRDELPPPEREQGAVGALALSGSTPLPCCGSFTLVNGSTARNRLAAFGAASGVAATGGAPNVDGPVSAIAVSGSDGLCRRRLQGSVNGLVLARLCRRVRRDYRRRDELGPGSEQSGLHDRDRRFDGVRRWLHAVVRRRRSGTTWRRSTWRRGARPASTPNLNSVVSALALSGSTVYAAGSFATVNGSTTRVGLAAFDAQTGCRDRLPPGRPRRLSEHPRDPRLDALCRRGLLHRPQLVAERQSGRDRCDNRRDHELRRRPQPELRRRACERGEGAAQRRARPSTPPEASRP